MNIPVFDLHCDTALALLGDDLRQCGSLRKNNCQIDLERASDLTGYAQCFACFTTDNYKHLSPVELFEREMATILRELERNNTLIRQAYTPQDIENNQLHGIMSAILTIEGPAGFGYDPELLQDLHLVGFRMTTLGWNEGNPLTGSHLTGDGLSDIGRAYVRESQRLGMVVDVSHISDQGFWDILDATEAPVIASHSNSRSVWNVSRNLTDDMFRAICGIDGVVGINFYADFLGQNPTVDTVCDHIFHYLEMDPDGKHIAIGSDFDGCDRLPEGIAGVQDHTTLISRLAERGLDESLLRNIFWNNAIGVMKRCCT